MENIPQENNDQKSDGTTEVKTLFHCWAEALQGFVNTSGRITRYEFWSFQTVSLLIFIVLWGFAYIFDAQKTIAEIYGLYFIMPFITSCVRRLHDCSHSGKYMLPLLLLLAFTLINLEYELSNVSLTIFLLLAYLSYLFPLLASEGEKTENQYGQVITEEEYYNFYSVYFIRFMLFALIVTWLIFFVILF